MDSTVTLAKLTNGLTIHLKEIHTAPIISHWAWYRVGSRNEAPGYTGISHWVEHMQFKGTPLYPASKLDKAISRTGGSWNAFTYLDWTTFYETLPADQIELALGLEKDRMVNSLFEPEEVESERNVILAELEGNQNEPRYRLGEAIQKAAFVKHPYRNEIIGSAEDLKRIQREDLVNHYRSFYHPGNAIVAVAGDFDTRAMLESLTDLYENIPPGELNHQTIAPETSLIGPREIELKGPGSTTFLQLAYRAPSARDKDFFTFMILDSLLCGPTSINIFGGGGTSNKTCRLYHALVETELTIGVRGGLQATIDPFLYEIGATLRPERSTTEVLTALDVQIDRLQQELVPKQEIARAAKQARALFAYGGENITNQAFWLGYAEIFADYSWFTGYLASLDQVTPADVQRVAQTYLRPECRVVGTYIPDGKVGGQS